MKNRSELGKLFQQHYKLGLGVEVGVQYGENALNILKYWKGDLICVDTWAEKGYDEIYEIAKQRLGERRLLRDYSLNAVNKFEPADLDFVYIDACHIYEYVKQDIEIWYPKVRIGGIISGHDYVEGEEFGVIQAVNEFVKDNNKELFLTTDEEFKTWWFVK